MSAINKPTSLLLAAFGIPLLYWIYLGFTYQTEIKWDSLDYQYLGHMINNQGWGEFFKTGPNREPLYPLLVALAMRLADGLQANYLKILVILQFGLLFLTQLFCFKLLQKLNIKPLIVALIVLYIGLSPALINCALMLFSEILVLPLIPASLLLITNIVSNPRRYSLKEILFFGVVFGITMAAMTFTKGVFELVWPATLLTSLLILTYICPNKQTFKRNLCTGLIAFITFFIICFTYKAINQHYNNFFAITNRGSPTLYSSVIRRTGLMAKEKILTDIAMIPGDGVCKRIYGEEKCYFWSTMYTDGIVTDKYVELGKLGLNGLQIDKEMGKLAFKTMLSHPFQLSFFVGLESIKIFFWESTKLGFVVYPGWLDTIYSLGLFKDVLRFLLAVLSLLGVIALCSHLWQTTRRQQAKQAINVEKTTLLVFMTVLILFYTAVYSLFFINTRYAVPLAPLFLCLTAMISQRFQKR